MRGHFFSTLFKAMIISRFPLSAVLDAVTSMASSYSFSSRFGWLETRFTRKNVKATGLEMEYMQYYHNPNSVCLGASLVEFSLHDPVIDHSIQISFDFVLRDAA